VQSPAIVGPIVYCFHTVIVFAGEENITEENEYNWYCDPEAAHAVLAGLNKLITLVPLKICLESSLSWVCITCCSEYCPALLKGHCFVCFCFWLRVLD